MFDNRPTFALIEGRPPVLLLQDGRRIDPDTIPAADIIEASAEEVRAILGIEGAIT